MCSVKDVRQYQPIAREKILIQCGLRAVFNFLLPVRLARTPGPLGLFSYFVLQPACVYVVWQYGVHLKACSSIGAVRARTGATCANSVLV